MALLAHPDDERHRELVGKEALTPLFGTRVPVMTHPLVEKDKGTGLVMVCTFGDLTDVMWWRELGLPVRSILGADGRLQEVPWGEPGWESEDLGRARAAAYSELVGLTINQARKRIVELLGAGGRPRRRAPAGDAGGEVLREGRAARSRSSPAGSGSSARSSTASALIERGRELHWHPPYMRARFEDWVNGLTGDWCISRQRFFGVPFPVWYEIDQHGDVCHERPSAARRATSCRSTPRPTCPPGYEPEPARDSPVASSATPT